MRDAAEPRADRLDRQAEHPTGERGERDGNQQARPMWANSSQDENDRNTRRCQGERRNVKRRQGMREDDEPRNDRPRLRLRQSEAEQILDLTRGYDGRYAPGQSA